VRTTASRHPPKLVDCRQITYLSIVYYVNVSATTRPRRTQAERLELSGRRLLEAAAALIAER